MFILKYEEKNAVYDYRFYLRPILEITFP